MVRFAIQNKLVRDDIGEFSIYTSLSQEIFNCAYLFGIEFLMWFVFLCVVSARRLGLCISGITVKGLVDVIRRDGAQSCKVLVLVGTNDILHAAKLTNAVSFKAIYN